METQQFKEALDNLVKAKIIYEKLATYKDTLEAVIYKEKVSQLDTLIRLCSFNLQGLLQGMSEEELLHTLVSNYPTHPRPMIFENSKSSSWSSCRFPMTRALP